MNLFSMGAFSYTIVLCHKTTCLVKFHFSDFVSTILNSNGSGHLNIYEGLVIK